MRNNRKVRRLVGVAAAAMISDGVISAGAAPAGVAQTAGCEDINGPIYCPPPELAPSTPGGTLTNALLKKTCVAKAQTKFGDNRPKMKKAIKACKKKYR